MTEKRGQYWNISLKLELNWKRVSWELGCFTWTQPRQVKIARISRKRLDWAQCHRTMSTCVIEYYWWQYTMVYKCIYTARLPETLHFIISDNFLGEPHPRHYPRLLEIVRISQSCPPHVFGHASRCRISDMLLDRRLNRVHLLLCDDFIHMESRSGGYSVVAFWMWVKWSIGIVRSN